MEKKENEKRGNKKKRVCKKNSFLTLSAFSTRPRQLRGPQKGQHAALELVGQSRERDVRTVGSEGRVGHGRVPEQRLVRRTARERTARGRTVLSVAHQLGSPLVGAVS